MKERLLVPERMDDPSLDPVEHRRALRGLRRVNLLCQTGKHLAREIIAISKQRGLNFVRVLDLGCGSGDVATDIGSRIDGKLDFSIEGWDISSTAVDAARIALKSTNERLTRGSIAFRQCDVFQATEERFDIVYCCLFLHHFSEEQAVELLKRMKGLAVQAVLVDDLVRSQLGLRLAQLGCHLLSRSPVVHFDGPQSVRAAFTENEACGLASQAGMKVLSLRRHWPERYLMRWDTPQ